MRNGRETIVSLKDIAPCVTDTYVNETFDEIVHQFSEICNNTVNTDQKGNENCCPDITHDVTNNVNSFEVPSEPTQNALHLPRSEPSTNDNSCGLRIGLCVLVKRLTATVQYLTCNCKVIFLVLFVKFFFIFLVRGECSRC